MAKKIMIGVAAAAAVVLISVAITGFPKVNSTGTLGAISAAKRAQTPQISASDVKTDDPSVQQFLQSDTFDRLMKSGEKLRAAQIAALEGKRADVRDAGEAHRRAIGEAVAEAERLAAESGAKPGADALARTFEALSLATAPAAKPGRLVEAMQPAGFEALLGVSPQPAKLGLAPKAERPTENVERRTSAAQEAAAKAAAAAEAKAAAEQKRHEAAVKAAEADLERVQAAEQKAREAWEKAHDELLAARQALTDVRRTRFAKPT